MTAPLWSRAERTTFLAQVALVALPPGLVLFASLVSAAEPGSGIEISVARTGLNVLAACFVLNACVTAGLTVYTRVLRRNQMSRSFVIFLLSIGTAEIFYYYYLAGMFSAFVLVLVVAVGLVRILYDRFIGNAMMVLAFAGLVGLATLTTLGFGYAPMFDRSSAVFGEDVLLAWAGCFAIGVLITILYVVIDLMAARLQVMSITDELTGLTNRRKLMVHLASALDEARRDDSTVSLILVDIDHFKQINDTHGHRRGDEVLVGVAHRIRSLVRDEDTVARYGGEEFAIVLDGDAAIARDMAERCREAFSDATIDTSGGKVDAPTLSLGVVTYPSVPARNPDELIHAADEALYTSKANGRNRITVGVLHRP